MGCTGLLLGHVLLYSSEQLGVGIKGFKNMLPTLVNGLLVGTDLGKDLGHFLHSTLDFTFGQVGEK